MKKLIYQLIYYPSLIIFVILVAIFALLPILVVLLLTTIIEELHENRPIELIIILVVSEVVWLGILSLICSLLGIQ